VAAVVDDRAAEEGDGRCRALVGEDFGVGEAGVVSTAMCTNSQPALRRTRPAASV
jgi:hypothetical protein